MIPQECPCGGGRYSACCRPVHEGTHWPETAEALMRSRYSAFVLGRGDHLWRTWHPRTRPAEVVVPDREWTGLEILAVADGGVGEDTGLVEFAAHYRVGRCAEIQHERSRFVRRAGRWFYLDAA